MLNIDHHQSSFIQSSTMGPRISFSNDFADAVKIQTSNYKEAPVSADFEFSVSNFSTFSSLNSDSTADEMFIMGKLLPLKETKTVTTLRDELLVTDVELMPQIPKGFSNRWNDMFSMKRRSYNEVKKSERRDSCLQSVAEKKSPAMILDNADHNRLTKKFTEEPSGRHLEM